MRRPRGQARKKRSTRGYYSSDGVSADEDNSTFHQPADISRLPHPDNLDQVLHDAMNSFVPITTSTSQKRGRPSNIKQIGYDLGLASKPKKSRLNQGCDVSKSSDQFRVNSKQENLLPVSQKSSSDVTQNDEETSLLKQLLEQNKTTSSTQQQPSS